MRAPIRESTKLLRLHALTMAVLARASSSAAVGQHPADLARVLGEMNRHKWNERASLRISALLAVLFIYGCAGDTTEPSLPDARGTYDLSFSFSMSSCTPQSMSTLFPGNFVFQQAVRVQQSGRSLTMEFVPATSVAVGSGTIDSEGKFTIDLSLGPSTIMSVTNRQFSLTQNFQLKGQFVLTANPLRANPTITGASVFREGSTTAPIFTTCTHSNPGSLTRTGG